jgi:hypothetical protein
MLFGGLKKGEEGHSVCPRLNEEEKKSKNAKRQKKKKKIVRKQVKKAGLNQSLS